MKTDDRKEDEVEKLKVHKIEPEPPHRHLPTVEQPHPYSPEEAELDEAYGGTGQKPAEPVDPEAVAARIIDELKTVYDPEIPVNIYELGLIYGIDVTEEGYAEIRMTLTAPACPVAGYLVSEVAEKAGRAEGVSRSHVKLVWDPPWSPEQMTEEAKLELGLI